MLSSKHFYVETVRRAYGKQTIKGLVFVKILKIEKEKIEKERGKPSTAAINYREWIVDAACLKILHSFIHVVLLFTLHITQQPKNNHHQSNLVCIFRGTSAYSIEQI